MSVWEYNCPKARQQCLCPASHLRATEMNLNQTAGNQYTPRHAINDAQSDGRVWARPGRDPSLILTRARRTGQATQPLIVPITIPILS